ncbi:hypothetical protein Sjap_011121 [Stephania japonica]|uniref:galactinol--sucrose galactosyltransferase n=1 Tax=Stephania japonica TaxID=461633 RepID=A0AAP0JAS8_9MAGN
MPSTEAIIKIADNKLNVNDQTILSDIPNNISSTSFTSSGCSVDGLFIGASCREENSAHIVSLGTLRDVTFLACFQFRLWWMSYKTGNNGRDVPLETQFLLIKSSTDQSQDSPSTIYAVFLPLIEGPFRASLQGSSPQEADHLQLCFESGDQNTKASTFTHSLFISAGTDPFAAISAAISAVKGHLQTFRQRHEKRLPGIVDLFGWCTWDAFYEKVTPRGIEEGLKTLSSGGLPPKFLIIDDGWQSFELDEHLEDQIDDRQNWQMVKRLTSIKENNKFNLTAGVEGTEGIIRKAKDKYGVKYVYMWHAITGYWGGVRPGGGATMDAYVAEIKIPRIPRGIMENEPCWESDTRMKHGIGVVNPSEGIIGRFYNDMHEYLAGAGVDGVKVDSQSVMQTLGEGVGGRVVVTRAYHEALDRSVARNFPDNGIIACMSHNTDSFYWQGKPNEVGSTSIEVKDCLFSDPSRDGATLLKIWNMNKYTGVIGVYNCQGAAWSEIEKKTVFHHAPTEPLTTTVKGSDVHLIAEASTDQWNGDCALYSHRGSELTILASNATVSVSLNILEFEIFTVSPIKEMVPGVKFAPLGLIEMYNGGGAIKALIYQKGEGKVAMEVKGCGRFGAYSSARPNECRVGSASVVYEFDSSKGLLILSLDKMAEEGQYHYVEIQF